MFDKNIPFNSSKEDFEIIADGILLYKNFINKEQCDKIVKTAESIKDNLWVERNWYKCTKKQIRDLLSVHEQIKYILKKDFYLGENLSLVKFVKGQTWNLHKDNHDSLHILEANSNIKEGEVVYPAEYTTHGVIFYFNEYEGAEISYPEIGIKYKPEKGDMLVHRSDIAHEVLALESDIRYTHSNKIFVYLDVPLGVK